MDFIRNFEEGYVGRIVGPVSSRLHIPALLFLVIIGVLISLFICVLKRLLLTKKGDLFLIVGLCNSGKTTLYYLLKRGEFVQTRTSQDENISEFEVQGSRSGKVYKIVDCPGHYRIRNTYRKHLAENPKKIIFMIDSSNFEKNNKEITPFFYEILSSEVVMDNLIPIYVVCNKTDVYGATSVKTIIRKTQNEIQQLIDGKSKVFGEEKERVVVNDESVEFSFKDNCRTRVEHISCSLKENAEDFGDILRVILQ